MKMKKVEVKVSGEIKSFEISIFEDFSDVQEHCSPEDVTDSLNAFIISEAKQGFIKNYYMEKSGLDKAILKIALKNLQKGGI